MLFFFEHSRDTSLMFGGSRLPLLAREACWGGAVAAFDRRVEQPYDWA